MAPRSAVCSARAAAIPSARLAGPSAPGALAGRIAPVRTIGGPGGHMTSHSTASSSSVSVPVVMTTPRPVRVSVSAARAELTVRVRSPGIRAKWGTAASSASASSAGLASRPPAPPTIAMVPPAARTVTSRTAPL